MKLVNSNTTEDSSFFIEDCNVIEHNDISSIFNNHINLYTTNKGLLTIDEIKEDINDIKIWEIMGYNHFIGNLLQCLDELSVESPKLITTNSGLKICCFPKLKYRIINKNNNYILKSLRDLCIDDNIIVNIEEHTNINNITKLLKFNSKHINIFTYVSNYIFSNITINMIQPDVINNDIVYILGFIYGSSKISDYKLKLVLKKDIYNEHIEKITNIFCNIFNIAISKNYNDFTIMINNHQFINWLKINNFILKNELCNLINTDKYQLVLCKTIRTMNIDYLKIFVNSIWLSQGKQINNDYHIISIRNIQYLLYILKYIGYIANIDNDKLYYTTKHDNKKHKIWNGYLLDSIKSIKI
jgi:hypothetical protein